MKARVGVTTVDDEVKEEGGRESDGDGKGIIEGEGGIKGRKRI